MLQFFVVVVVVVPQKPKNSRHIERHGILFRIPKKLLYVMVLADIFLKYCIKKQTIICKHEVNRQRRKFPHRRRKKIFVLDASSSLRTMNSKSGRIIFYCLLPSQTPRMQMLLLLFSKTRSVSAFPWSGENPQHGCSLLNLLWTVSNDVEMLLCSFS